MGVRRLRRPSDANREAPAPKPPAPELAPRDEIAPEPTSPETPASPAGGAAVEVPPGEPPSPPVAAGTKAMHDPGGVVAVPPAKSGLERIGSDRCRPCHKLQYESWAASPHARREPPLDCESCHGAGSEYRKRSTMQDAALARAAGLVVPDAVFCSTCHGGELGSAFAARAHAHQDDGR